MLRYLLATIAGAYGALLSAQTHPAFTFTKVDLQLLDQVLAFDRLLERRALVFHDAALDRRLTDLATPLLPRAPLERVEWHIRVLRDPMVNAFALPNGSIYLNTGLLARAENDDQIAGVLAHEVTHVVNRHGYMFNRSLRKKVVASEIIAAAAAWIPAGSWGFVVTIGANMGQFTILDMVYGYSRELEEDADRTGLSRMKEADHDPRQMIRMFELLDEKLEPEPVPRLFWDHPRLKERIAYLKKSLGVTALPSPESDPEYVERMRAAFLQNIQLDLDSRRFRSAVAVGRRLADVLPNDATVLYWLGESYRLLGPRQPLLKPEEITDAGLRKGYKNERRRTEDEETAELASTPEGREILAANLRQAEGFYRRAIAGAGTPEERQRAEIALSRMEAKRP